MNAIQPVEKVIYVERPQAKARPLSTAVIVFAILYWLSPIDALPFIPIDDIVMMVAALWYSGMFGGGAE